MGISLDSKSKKDLNVELNLMPVFDILSVCIAFLLMTVVWIQVGVIKGSQSVGGQSVQDTNKRPALWIVVDENRNVTFSYHDTTNKHSPTIVKSQNGDINWYELERLKDQLINQKTVQMALIFPSQNTKYESIIHTMDLVKKNGIYDVGVSPL